MNCRGIALPVVAPALVLALLFPPGCVPHGPTLYERSPHVVAVVIAPSAVESGIQGMPASKAEGAGKGADAATKGLWSGCAKALPSGGSEIAAAMGIVVLLVCAGLTPLVAAGGAIAGAAGSSWGDDVDRAKEGLGQNLPDRDRSIALFEKNLYAEHEGTAGHSFRNGKDFGLQEKRPGGDYRDLAAKGADAVLEVDRFVVALSGKNLESELSLRVCAVVKLEDTLDNAVLYQAERCENGSSTMSLDAWKTDQWAAVQNEMNVAIERLATNLAWYVFHGNKEPAASQAETGERQVSLQK